MLEILNYSDISQQYYKNLVRFNDKYVKILSVNKNLTVDCWDLAEQTPFTTLFNLSEFKAPNTRLGMINIDNKCFYVTRIPIRRMEIGINIGNTVFIQGNGEHLKDSPTYYKAQSFTSKEWINTIENKYPSFTEAVKLAQEDKGNYAFDKQFAVSGNGKVFYKGIFVGTYKGNHLCDIDFLPNFKYLLILLEGNHEKTIGITCS